LIEQSDLAPYCSKHQGRDRITHYDDRPEAARNDEAVG
jgi:hypothetical protein